MANIIQGRGLPNEFSVVPPKHDVKVPAHHPAPPIADEYAKSVYAGVPINLYGAVTLQPNTQQTVNAIALKNPNSGPMILNEIKFVVFSGSGQASNFSGNAVSVQLMMGNIPLTNGYVPLWLLGRCEALTAELGTTVLYFRYRFPRPVYVPPGGAILPTLQHNGIPGNISLTVGVSYGGRALAPSFKPKKVYLPYFSSFVSKAFDIDAADTDASKETDLVNQFAEPLFIDRFSARVNAITNLNTQDDYSTSGFVDLPELVDVRMVDSLGNPIVKDFSPVYCVCPGVERSWALNGDVQLPSSAYYYLEVQKNATTVAAANGFRVKLGFSMAAWREVKHS